MTKREGGVFLLEEKGRDEGRGESVQKKEEGLIRGLIDEKGSLKSVLFSVHDGCEREKNPGRDLK